MADPRYSQREDFGTGPSYNANDARQPHQLQYAPPSVGYGQQSLPHQPQPAGQQMARVTFSPDDMRMLRECNRESFYYRCLPLVIVANAGVKYFSKTPSPGVRVASHVGASITAWLGGKLSYRKACEDKILNSGLNTPLVHRIRIRRGLQPLESAYSQTEFGESSGHEDASNDPYSNFGRDNESFDTTREQVPRSQFEDKRDMFRDSYEQRQHFDKRGLFNTQDLETENHLRDSTLLDDDNQHDNQQGSSNPPVTYDGLRDQNRRQAFRPPQNPQNSPPRTF